MHIGSNNREDDGVMRRTSVHDVVVVYNVKSGQYLSEVLLQVPQKAARNPHAVHWLTVARSSRRPSESSSRSYSVMDGRFSIRITSRGDEFALGVVNFAASTASRF